jgi:hypothetical protein
MNPTPLATLRYLLTFLTAIGRLHLAAALAEHALDRNHPQTRNRPETASGTRGETLRSLARGTDTYVKTCSHVQVSGAVTGDAA